MRKILYVLCLLTTLVACSDDDDKIITDYDKPYSKLPTSELRTLIEDNINSCITLVEEFAEMEENNSILDIMNYYGINFYFDISDFMNSRSSDQSKENTFTGMKLVWNKNKQDFDTTINAAGFMEAFFPSSKTDQSNNDLHFIATIDYSTGVYLKIEVSNGKEVLLHKAQQYNKETSEAKMCIRDSTQHDGFYRDYHAGRYCREQFYHTRGRDQSSERRGSPVGRGHPNGSTASRASDYHDQCHDDSGIAAHVFRIRGGSFLALAHGTCRDRWVADLDYHDADRYPVCVLRY